MYGWCRGAAARLAVGKAMRGAKGRQVRPAAAVAPGFRGAHRRIRAPRTRISGGAKPEPGVARLASWMGSVGPTSMGQRRWAWCQRSPGVPGLVAHRRGRGLFVGGTGDSGEVGFR